MKFLKDKLLIAIVIIALLLIGTIAITGKGKTNVSFPENIVGFIISPIQGFFSSIGSKTGNALSNILNYKAIVEENKALKEELNKVKADNRKVYQLEMENETFRSMLDFAEENQDYTYIGANIIAKDPGNWFDGFTIDKGSADGVIVSDAIILGAGLVGKVVEVGTNYAKVVSIIDERSSVSVLVNRTREPGIVKGNADKLIVAEMSDKADIIIGDEIVTSDYSNYPKGLYLGQVTNVTLDDSALYKFVEIKPAVDFDRLEQVFVVKTK